MSDPLIFRDDIERAGWFAVYAAHLQALTAELVSSHDAEESSELWADDAVRASRKRTHEPRDSRRPTPAAASIVRSSP